MSRRQGGPSNYGTQPEPLSRILNRALEGLRPADPAAQPSDGIIFAGNRHDSVPRSLFTDARLTPLERNAWQVFRILLNDDGVTAFPTYAQLRPYLSSTPCSGQASDETIARALTLLRLTRWLTLARHRRDRETGRIQGNLYVLHDEPLCPYESIQLDACYLELVCHALTHASKAIQQVAHYTLKEITEDPLLSGRVLPSRLQVLMQRLSTQEWAQSPSSESEEGENADDTRLRIPKTAGTSTVRSLLNNKERTVLSTEAASPLRLPERFGRLPQEQQNAALATLQRVPEKLRQQILDEWEARCRTSTVRDPAAYLFGLVQKAMKGNFKAWAGPRVATSSQNRVSPQEPASRDVAEHHIAKLQAMLRTQDRN